MPDGIPVFWMMNGTGVIHCDNAVSVDGDRVIFEDGGWNHVGSCFFSEDQCRKYHSLPPVEWSDDRKVVCDHLQSLIDELRRKP